MLGLSQEDVRYEIDPHDHIVYVNQAWTDFAEANQSAYLAEPHVLQHSLWDFISGYETRFFYEQMFGYVRSTGETVRFFYRCDSPDTRRYMSMALLPRPHDHLLFVSRTLRLEARPHLPLLDVTQPRQLEMVNICGWCKQVEVEKGQWCEIEQAVDELRLFMEPVMPQLSHGMCPACLHIMRQEIARYKK